jgi:glycolate dehydrogenase FAD-linked subunit
MKAELQRYLTSHSLLFDDPSSRRIYSFDQGEVPPSLRQLLLPNSEPDLVVQPGSLQDLVGCIRFAKEKQVALVPRGASTFGMGGAVPHRGGILLDFSTRREIYELNQEHQMIRVGAGCRWSDVSQYLGQFQLELCTYPTSWFSTIGGWASTGGVGIGCTRYGSFHQLIESITVATASGETRTLKRNDPELEFFLGTEGQMGAIWDITFKIRTKPARQTPFLTIFDSENEALGCAAEMLSKFQPYHLKFLDAPRIQEINHLLREEHPNLKSGLDLIEKPTLLACMEENTDDFRLWAQKQSLFLISDYRAHLLWRERMFPLRVKRVAPGLLASELILPIDRVAKYVRKTASLGKKFGVELANECYFLNDQTALTLPVYTFRSKNKIDEALKSSLSYVLTETGIRMGGRPYGIGIWNSPFLKHKYGNRLKDFRNFKGKMDSGALFNPGKFFDLQFRTGLAGKLAALPLNSALIPVWTRINPILASMMTTRTNQHAPRNEDLILENEELCSKCGSCISVCPAYIDTKDERTTARGKLQLGKWMLSGGALTAEEANTLFLCMHCGACTDVCQSRLDLVPVWDELEKRVAEKFGKDQERVGRFVKSVEEKKIMGVPYAQDAEVLIGDKPK